MRPEIIKTYITTDDGVQHYIPADCSFTRSTAWNTSERRSYDGTGTANTIGIMRKSGRQPVTYQINFHFTAALEDQPITTLVSEYESLVGKQCELTYSAAPFGRVIIESGNFVFSTDAITGVPTLSISFSLKETKLYTPSTARVNIHFD